MSVLIDTSFLLAVFYRKDKHHELALRASSMLRSERIVAAPAIVETFFMTFARVNYAQAIRAFEHLTTSGFRVIDPVAEDMIRMQAIMNQYRDAELDFVDVAQMAIAERLNIRQVYTFDRRDFSLFRPKHTEFLELLP
ncbi:MAG: PIN domain-containing protein [Anaerolineae bacterium]|nr:PIN domain-containing protein [Anaerolineae bacterium]